MLKHPHIFIVYAYGTLIGDQDHAVWNFVPNDMTEPLMIEHCSQ